MQPIIYFIDWCCIVNWWRNSLNSVSIRTAISTSFAITAFLITIALTTIAGYVSSAIALTAFMATFAIALSAFNFIVIAIVVGECYSSIAIAIIAINF